MSEKYQNNKNEYDVTNVIKKLDLDLIKKEDINFNLLPEILIHHHDDLVNSSGLGKYFSRGIPNYALRTIIADILRSCIRLKYGKKESNEILLDCMQNDTKITQHGFDYLLTNTRLLIKNYNEIIDIIDNLISTNGGNEKILNSLKTTIENGHFLSEKDNRYLSFCSLELEKKKIHESGIVPIGWLPLDTQDLYQSLESQELINKGLRDINKIQSLGIFWSLIKK